MKLKGINYVIEKERLGIINENRTMVVSIDVTYLSAGSKEAVLSIAAVVANYDKWLA